MGDGHWIAGFWRPVRDAVRLVRDARGGPANGFGGPALAPNGTPVDGAGQPELPRDQTQKMESLGRLTGGVAHDFNNLLTVVLGNATALRINAETRGDTEGVRRAEMIERAAERGGRLAGQLLAFSRNQMLRPETISVYQVISAMHELLGQAAGEAVRVLLLSEADLWSCRVDPRQLESAILNLVLNARDAMPAGGSVEISCHNQSARASRGRAAPQHVGDTVRIDVRDTGVGIPPELQEKVFEPFFTTKPIGKGSGLGLAQVHGFAGQSGGWVELRSITGTGTTVSLFLPRATGRQADTLAQVTALGPAGNNQTVLIVEPNPDLRAAICEILSQSGYRGLAVADAAGALAYLVSDERIHVLLTEALLPGGVRGADLARSARQMLPDLRALVTSGAPDEAIRSSQTADGAYEFLKKPYRAADLVRVVGGMLKSGTFSVETERLLADVRDTEYVPPQEAGPAAGQDSFAASRLAVLPRPGEAVPGGDAIRIGVMPFKTTRSDSESAFSLGLADEITKAFSRFRGIACVTPASMAALAGEPVGKTERWRQLDLDFLLDGSLRRKGGEIGVLVRLINMRGSGEITWRRRFGGSMPDVLNLQDEIAAATAAQVVPEALVWEGREAASRPQVNPTAYDLMLRAIPAVYCLEQAGFQEAERLLERSLELDPGSAACRSWLAHWYHHSVGQGWEADPARAIQRADQLAQEAVLLDPEDARAFTVAGHVRAFLHKDSLAAIWLHNRAIELNPNLALAWCYSGLAHTYLGQHAEAIRRIEHAQHLSPYDPHGFFYEMALTMPFLLTGQYEIAARIGRHAREAHPGFSSTYKVLLSALGHLHASREASVMLKEFLKLEPKFSLREARSRSPLLQAADLDCYIEGLRLAGVS
jgi:nitrogen-specific signal transduction histidine kinase/TolB-like protein/DNA-binding NarL/FixJ family response regulator